MNKPIFSSQYASDIEWMRRAYTLALRAQSEGEVPVGTVLVSHDQQLLGSGWNCVRQNQNPTAHAELIAIQAAAEKLNNYRLLNTTLYVTLEPCCMCAGALVHARVKRLVFATRDWQAGAAGSVYNILRGYPLNHQVIIDEGPLQQECSDLLIHFFNQRRIS